MLCVDCINVHFFRVQKKLAFESIRGMASNINLPKLAKECVSKVEDIEQILKLKVIIKPLPS
jgi:hypothetical protein